MSTWIDGQIVRWAPTPIEGYDGHWWWIDCGCCNGLEWGGESPRECKDCSNSHLALHVTTGLLALYVGGPFRGRLDRHTIEKELSSCGGAYKKLAHDVLAQVKP